MKYKYLLLFVAVSFLTTSFKNPNQLPPGRTYNLFYVDNSYSKSYENLNTDMYNVIERKVDSLKNDKFSLIGFFMANGSGTDFASNYNGAKGYIGRLSDGNSNTPNSFYDRGFVIESLLSTDISNVKGININFFLTEAGLLNDYLSGINAGILINSLPKEIQFIVDCKEENISVTIYYPAGSKKVTAKALESFTNFSGAHKDFVSKIKYRIQPI